MSSTKRMAALVIGVADAQQLPYLPGAVNGAHAFHKWAKALGYTARLVTDEKKPVTVERLRRVLERLLAADDGQLHRLLIYFAGHGVIKEAEQGLWLLSDWRQELRAVYVEALRRRLGYYDVKQVAIFADACRSLPTDIDLADLTPDAVLGKGPKSALTSMKLDKFIAAQDAAETFMIPGPNPQDDRCLFSGVLLEGLWGKNPTAFSRQVAAKVTSRSLGDYLEGEVPRVAAHYGFNVTPTVIPTFSEGDDVYFGDPPPVKPPDLPPWPPREAVREQGVRARAASARTGPPPASRRRAAERSARRLEEGLRQQERPDSFETGAGFAVQGAKVDALWTRGDMSAGAPYRRDWWHVGGPRPRLALLEPTPVLIELAGGRFAAVTAVPFFVASLVVGRGGVLGLVYRERHSQPSVAEATERALGQMERGALGADAATDLAVELRQGKHDDPVRGVISAYLYDSVGDVDSIRRMAFYYVRRGQAIPYDIALLAQLTARRRGKGPLEARVPAVRRRKPRTEEERRFSWTHAATDRATGAVAGFWPWLKQGWAFLDEPAPRSSALVLTGLTEMSRRLGPARFPTLDDGGGRRLAELFGLVPNRAR